MSEDERCAPTTVTALLFGGMLDGHQTEILLDEDGCAPLERLFVGFATCSMPYRLATVRPDGVHVYVPLYGQELMMGLRPLGEKWRRRIGAVVGQEVAWANGGGGQAFVFRTPGPIGEHRHGWFDRHAYMSLPPEQRAQPVEPGEVWDWDDDEGHWWSCSSEAAT